jgi:hypothetical protein
VPSFFHTFKKKIWNPWFEVDWVWALALEFMNREGVIAYSNPPQLVLGHKQTISSIFSLIQFFFHSGVFLISPGAGEGVSVPRPSQPP